MNLPLINEGSFCGCFKLLKEVIKLINYSQSPKVILRILSLVMPKDKLLII